MPNLWTLLRRGPAKSGEARYSFSDWANDRLTFGGMTYPLLGMSSLGRTQEDIENSFTGYVQGAYKSNGPIFACVLARLLLFSEARFCWQDMSSGRPGELAGGPELRQLERPWPNGTTGELLGRMEQDVSLAGNAYVAREPGRLRRLRPDWVSIILTAPPAEAAQVDVAGYAYRPGGTGEPVFYLPEEICHWSPVPDPDALYRGMSWVTPVVREIQADKAATAHKLAFFQNGATLNAIVSFKETVTPQQFKDFVAKLDTGHAGTANAYKTLYVGGGADVSLVGSDLKQLDFRAVQGAGETRVTAAAGVPAVIVGLSEGLQAATYSNYSQARRKFGDHWARPTWRSVCAALEAVVPPRPGSRLWYDDRDISFLREDQKDAAEIQRLKSSTIRMLVDAGYTPDSVVASVEADDRTLLVHSGLYSVQLQPAGSAAPTPGGGGDA